MCYHFSRATSRMKLEILSGFTEPPTPPVAGYHIVPSTLIVRVTSGKRELVNLKWDLVPHWNTAEKPLRQRPR